MNVGDEMSIEEMVLNFRDFLNASWSSIRKILYILDWDGDSYFLDDWIEANWELLVDRQISNAVLVPYGVRYPESRHLVEEDRS